MFWTHKFAAGLIDMGNSESQDSEAQHCKWITDYGRQHFYYYFLNPSENSTIYLTIILNQVFGTQKNRLNETALLSTHNICFDQKLE